MSIVKAYANLLGGSVNITSEVGVGSQFSFHLTEGIFYETEKSTPSDEVGVVDTETFALSSKILVAEDENINYLLLHELLKGKVQTILRAKNGVEAVELYKKNPDIGLIFMDIKMPKMDGVEATKEIRKINDTVPIIALTAYALSGDREKFISNGCSDYLSKPVAQKDVEDILKYYFDPSKK